MPSWSKASVLALIVAMLILCGCRMSPRHRTPWGTPDPGLPVAPSLLAGEVGTSSPSLREALADEPMGLWPLGRAARPSAPLDGTTAVTLGDLTDAGDRAFTVELWTQRPRGPLLSYSSHERDDALVLEVDGTVSLTIMGQTARTDVAVGGDRWHHLAVTWRGDTGMTRLFLDGALAWQGTLAAGLVIPSPGVAVIGRRQRCWGGCLRGRLEGTIGGVAWHDQALTIDRMRSRMLVEQGARAPTPRPSSLPVEFRKGGGGGGRYDVLAFSPDGRFAAVAGASAVHLWDLELGKVVYDFRGHDDVVEAIAYDPAGRYVATIGSEARIFVWDTATGRLAHRLDGHRRSVRDIAFSPDGRWLLSGSTDGSARLWDVASGRQVRELSAGDRVKHVAFSPDGTLAAASVGDERVVLWDVGTGARRHELTGGSQPVALLFTPDGAQLVGGFETRVVVWDVGTGAIARTMQPPADGRTHLLTLQIDRTGRRLVGSTATIVRLWDLASGRLERTLEGHDTGVWSVAFSPDGQRVLSCDDRTMRLWDARSGAALPVVGGGASVAAAVFSPDGERVLASEGGSFTLRGVHDGQVQRSYQTQSRSPGQPALSPDGDQLMVSDGRGLTRWDLTRAQPMGHLEDPPPYVGDLVFGPDGRRVLSRGREIQLWDLDRERALRTMKIGGNGPVAWSPSAMLIAASDGRARVHVLDAHSGRTLHVLEGVRELVSDLEFSPDGRWLAAGGGRLMRAGTAIVWDPRSGRRVHQLVEGADQVRAVSFSPDGRTLAVVGWGGDGELFDVVSGRRRHVLRGHRSIVYGAEFSRDGSLLVTCSEDTTARVWDPRSGRALATLEGHRYPVRRAVFSPDGRYVLTFSEDGELRLWHSRTGKRLRRLRADVPEAGTIGFDPRGRWVWASSADGVLLWATDSGHRLTLTSEGDEWMMYTEDGYFDASPAGVQLVTMGQGRRLFGADQLALTRNRPDIILERFGLGTPALREHFERRYRRRRAKAGLRSVDVTSTVELPHARIARVRDRGDARVELLVDLRDSAGLESVQVYVDDVPIFPGGKPISGRHQRLDETIVVTDGRNKIEVSATNVDGHESLRALEYVDHEDPTPGDLYFLGFGVSRYRDSRLDLQFAHQDALDLARVFSAVGGFGRVHAKTFVDDQVTVANLDRARAFVARAQPRDTFVLFVAGHGIHDDDPDSTYYYVTHEADPQALSTTAATFEVIERLLYDAPPRRKLLLLDTCESGERVDEAGAGPGVEQGGRGLHSRAIRGLELDLGTTAAAAGRPPLPRVLEAERLIYTDLARRSGAIVFSSSRGDEQSYESPAIRNGFFTEEILAAMTSDVADEDHDGLVSTDELRRYVSGAVARATDGQQNPTVDRDNIHQKFGFSIVR